MLVHYRSKETSIIHQLQEKQEYLRGVWSKCFHSNRDSCQSKLPKETVVDENRLQHKHIEKTDCKVGYVARNGMCMACPQGTFALEQWIVCVHLLTCNELQYGIQIGSALYQLGNWELYAARWNTYDVIYAVFLSSDDGAVVFDFESVKGLVPHDNLLYPIGMCDEDGDRPELLFAWRDDVLGRADKLDSILMRKTGCDNEIVRFKLAIDYVQILVHLHTGYIRSRSHNIMCNSHSLSLLLSQFLVTADSTLILGAFDNLPMLKMDTSNNKGAKIVCSQRELKGSFVAPEQKWPYQSSKVFNPTQQPGYTEKTDIWKIPDIALALLGKGGEKIKNFLAVMHRKCKNLEASKRPTALQVLREYQLVWNMLGLNPLCQ